MDYIIMGQRIRRYRVRKHLTQEQLAELTDISPSFLGHIERGSRIASLETVMKLCAALSVTPNDLLGDALAEVCAGLPPMMEINPVELLHHIALLLERQENR